MVAFIGSIVVLGACIGVFFFVAKRRDPAAPLLWGDAMIAATFAFFVMFWAYGVVPHQWLQWADSELGWRKDNLIFTSADNVAIIGRFIEVEWPLDLSWQAVRDLVATGIYIVLLGVQIALWSVWQGRGKAKSTDIVVSDYGRPLVRES